MQYGQAVIAVVQAHCEGVCQVRIKELEEMLGQAHETIGNFELGVAASVPMSVSRFRVCVRVSSTVTFFTSTLFFAPSYSHCAKETLSVSLCPSHLCLSYSVCPTLFLSALSVCLNQAETASFKVGSGSSSSRSGSRYPGCSYCPWPRGRCHSCSLTTH